MPNTPTTSFIPKQGPARRAKQTASRQIHLLMIIAYVSLVASLLASVGVFFFQKHVDKQLTNEVEKLSEAISGFSDTDMERVREFNLRLAQAKTRLDHGVSIVSIFEALEGATVKAATIDELQLKKENDTEITLSAKIATDSFDSSMFQRGLFERNDVIDTVAVKDISIVEVSDEESITSGVSFLATLIVPTAAVAIPSPDALPTEVIPAFDTVVETSSTTESLSTTTPVVSDEVFNQQTP